MARLKRIIAAVPRAFTSRFQTLGLVAQFSIVGFCVGVVLATAIAFLSDRLLTDLLLVQLATRAADQVSLVFEEQLTSADFEVPVSRARRADIAMRLDPLVSQLRDQPSGIIRLYIYGRDGTILYSDVVARRGQPGGADTQLFDQAINGSVASEVSPLTTGENADLKARYGDALEVYVPFRLNGQIVGVYEVFQALDSIRPVQPIVLANVFGGFAVLFVALLLVVQSAAERLRRQELERGLLEEQLRQSQKLEAIGQLAGGIAHDFNNLLTVIDGYSELLLARDDLTLTQRQAIEQILQAGESASSLTRQFLAFSRRQIVLPKEIDLNQIVERSARMLQRLIGEDIRFSLLVGREPGVVLADPGQIEQILMNLAANARDAMPRGGTLTIQTANVELTRSYTQNHPDARVGPHVMVAVTDTGFGMDEAIQARMFEPFYSTKNSGQGTGLGLAAVDGIVKQNKGSIDVFSKPGQSTTLKIYLPRVDATAQPGLPSSNVNCLGKSHAWPQVC